MSETSQLDPPDAAEIKQLCEKHYNATIIERIDVHEELARFRIRPDNPVPPFEPGQYVTLALGNWEPRLLGTQPEDLPANRSRKLARRAYSISCPLVDAQGKVATVDSVDYLEFYITLVRHAATPKSAPPALTPRLFGKGVGDRMALGKKITGKYRLGRIDQDDTVLFLATGTGEAPHNAMAATLLADGHRGKVVSATSIRRYADAAYASEHQTLMRQYPQYRYLALTTREPENLDREHPNFVGKLYLQTLFSDGRLAEMAGDPLDPANTHVFLCGNPAMIGYVPPGAPPAKVLGMLPLLERAGFRDEADGECAGCIRYEKYW